VHSIVPDRQFRPRLVVADAGVDDHAARRRLDDEGVDAHLQSAFLGHEMREKPGRLPQRLGRCHRQDEFQSARHLLLDDLGYRHVTDPPFQHLVLPC
jgi:hypothetical protein